jgi:hypothetical protein
MSRVIVPGPTESVDEAHARMGMARVGPAPTSGAQANPDRVVRCNVIRPHFQGNTWFESGTHYDAPYASVMARVILGQIIIDPSSLHGPELAPSQSP